MSVREYVGARYVPVFANPLEWNASNTYEPLTVVLYQGNSFTSIQAVPAGIAITNTSYWAQTGNYNAQIEQYRQDVATIANKFPVSVLDGGTGGTDAATARTNLDAAQADGATNTLYDAEQAIAANAANIISLQNSMLHGFTYQPGSANAFYLPTSRQFVINFYGRFTDENGVVYERAQLSLSRELNNVKFQALTTGGTWETFVQVP